MVLDGAALPVQVDRMEQEQTLAAIVLAAMNLINVIVSTLNRCRLQRLEKSIDAEATIAREDRNEETNKARPRGTKL